MEPLISIQLTEDDSSYRPGDVLECDYQIDAVLPEEGFAVEQEGRHSPVAGLLQFLLVLIQYLQGLQLLNIEIANCLILQQFGSLLDCGQRGF